MILRVDLKEETKKLTEALNFTGGSSRSALTAKVGLRVFDIGEAATIEGHSVKQLEKQFNGDFVIETIVRNQQTFTATADTLLQAHDYIVAVGDVDDFLAFLQKDPTAKEIVGTPYRQIDLKTTTVMLTRVFSHHALTTLLKNGVLVKIGRASCRERVSSSV